MDNFLGICPIDICGQMQSEVSELVKLPLSTSDERTFFLCLRKHFSRTHVLVYYAAISHPSL